MSQLTPKKKMKRFCSFNDNWLNNETFKSWLIKHNDEYAKCKICQVCFTVKHDGVGAIKQHLNSLKHNNMEKQQKQNQLLHNFFESKSTSENGSLALCELSFIYHTVKHHHSYNSADCFIKNSKTFFPDSKLAQKLRCGRTKMEAIVKNVLAKASLEKVLYDLKNGSVSRNTSTSEPNTSRTTVSTDIPVISDPIPYSIACDASNHGDKKMFPLIIRYFTLEKGIQNKIIEFYEDANETAIAISQKITEILIKSGLSTKNMISFLADNASVNFGKHHSVYKLLKEKHNSSLIAANCLCHVLNNSIRQANKKLPYDIENLVIKVYNEFSVSAQNIEQLKDCFEFVNLEYENILRHVPTRWLSLYPAVDRLLKCWPAIKTYFLQQDNVHQIILQFINNQRDETTENISSFLSLPECYLYFIHNVMNLFHVLIAKLESNTVTVIELHNILCCFRDSLKSRINEKFFGYKVNQALSNLTMDEKNSFEQNATNFLSSCISYLEKWYNFKDSPFQYFSNFCPSKLNSFQDVIKVAEVLKVQFDGDQLYEEYIMLKTVAYHIDRNLPVDQQWLDIFKKCSFVTSNLLKIVQTVLLIPTSNAFPERVFSLMGQIWTKQRNRMEVELVKAELYILINFNMSCSEFLNYVRSKPKLLKAVTNTQKYNFN